MEMTVQFIIEFIMSEANEEHSWVYVGPLVGTEPHTTPNEGRARTSQ